MMRRRRALPYPGLQIGRLAVDHECSVVAVVEGFGFFCAAHEMSR